MPSLNTQRLRVYPTLALIAAGSVMIANALTRQGWIGRLNEELMFGNFLVSYTVGLIHHTDLCLFISEPSGQGTPRAPGPRSDRSALGRA